MRVRAACRSGVAVPLVLVLVVALGLLGAGALALAQREATAARAAVAWTRGRLVARGVARAVAVSLTADALPPGALWTPVPLSRGSTQGVEYGVELRALGPEWTLVAGWARGSPMGGRAEEAALLWSLDPVARVAAMPAVLVHGGPLVRAADAVVEGTGVTRAGEGGSTTRCAPWSAALDSVFPSGWLEPTALDPEPDSQRVLPALGLLGPDELGERVPDRATGTVTPLPVEELGMCRDDPDNWGAPTEPDGPCGGRRATRYVEGDLVMVGGEGQGLLLVEGSLTLEDGAVFAGLVVVRDTLRLDSGARITGFARSGGPAVLGSGALVRGRACPVLLGLDGALDAAPALGGPLPAPGGAWIRPF